MAEVMKTEVKNAMTNDERVLVQRALSALKASILRAKTKEGNDSEMADIYTRRMVQVDNLMNRIMNKELF